MADVTGVELSERTLVLRFKLLSQIVQGITWTIVVLASTIPLLVMRDTVETVAGKETIVDASVTISVAATLSIGVNVVLWAKGRYQRSELKRQRTRISDLERMLGLTNTA